MKLCDTTSIKCLLPWGTGLVLDTTSWPDRSSHDIAARSSLVIDGVHTDNFSRHRTVELKSTVL